MAHDDDSSDDADTVLRSTETQRMEDSLLPQMVSIPPFVDGLDQADTEIVDRPLRYERKKLLGKGGGGVVISVYDRKMRRPVALKLANSTESERAARMRFLREAQVTGQLSHPNVMPVYDIGTDTDGEVFFTMKEVHGESLSELIREGRAGSLVERLLVFRQVCNAIAFAHSRNVLHRDIKPANIMVGEYGEVLVVDWGLCKIIGEEEPSTESVRAVHADDSLRTQDGFVAGTPAYMAPEQAQGDTERFCEQTDIYSLGAVLYTLLTEKPPFFGKVDTVLEKVIQGDFEPPRMRAPAAVPKELDAIVCKAMATSLHSRYASVRELSEDVQAFMESRPVSVVRYNAMQRAVKWAVRHQKVLRPVGLTAALGLVALISGGLVHINQMEQVTENALAEAHRANQAERAALVEAVNGRAALATAEAQTGRAGLAAVQLAEIREEMNALGTDTILADIGLSVLKKTALVSDVGITANKTLVDVSFSLDGSRLAYLTLDSLNVIEPDSGESILSHSLPPSVFVQIGPWEDGVPWLMGREQGSLFSKHLPSEQQKKWRMPLETCSPRNIQVDGGQVMTHCPRIGLVSWSWENPDRVSIDRFDDVDMRISGTSADGRRKLVFRYKDDFSENKAIPAVLEGNRVVWEDPSKSMLASISPNGRYVVGDAASGFQLHRIDTGQTQRFLSDFVGQFLWKPDSSGFEIIFQNGDRAVHALDRPGDEIVPIPSLALFQAVDQVHRSANGEKLVFWHKKNLQIFTENEVNPPLLDLKLQGRKEGVTEAELSPDGRLLALGADNGKLLIVDPVTGHTLWDFSTSNHPVRALSFGPRGDLLVSGHWDGAARVWDLTNGEILRTYHPAKASDLGGPPKVTEVNVLDDHRVLLTGSCGHIGIWSLEDGRLLTDFSGAVRYVWDSGYHAGRDKVYVSNRRGQDDGRIGAVLDLQTGAIAIVPGKRSAYGLTVSPNGDRWIINNSGYTSIVADDEGNVMRELPTASPPSLSSSWSADGRLVFVSDWSGEYQIWTTNDWESVGTWRDGTMTSRVVFAPDKRLLYVVSYSGQLRTLSLVGPDFVEPPVVAWLASARKAVQSGRLADAKAAAMASTDQDGLARVWLGALSKEGHTTSHMSEQSFE